jgi:hypothetical protein
MGGWKMIVRLAILLLLLATSSSFAEDSGSSPLEGRGECARNVIPSAGVVRVRTLVPPPFARSIAAWILEQLREGLMVGHPDMPTFGFTREAARAFLLYLRSIQAQ